MRGLGGGAPLPGEGCAMGEGTGVRSRRVPMRQRHAYAILPIFWLILWAIAISATAEKPEPPPRLVLVPCRLPDVPDLPDGARCGTYEVFEDRDARAGRKIALN